MRRFIDLVLGAAECIDKVAVGTCELAAALEHVTEPSADVNQALATIRGNAEACARVAEQLRTQAARFVNSTWVH